MQAARNDGPASSSLPEAASYSAIEGLRDGRRIEIRALRPDDRAAMKTALQHTSSDSIYRRFFGPKRGFSEREIAFFMDVDFVTQVALVAVVDHAIAAGGRYIVVEAGVAEVAFVVVDQYQGLGIGSALLRHLAALARRAGLKQFTAEVLTDNRAMLAVFERSGLRMETRRASGVVHVMLDLS